MRKAGRRGRGRAPRAPAVDGGPAADGHEHLVGVEPELLPVAGLDDERGVAREPPRLGAGQPPDAERVEGLRHRAGKVGLVLRQDARQRLYHGHVAPELGEGGAELEPDVASADDHQPVGAAGERQRVGRGDHRAAEGQERQLDRDRAGRDDHGLGADDLEPDLGLDLDRLAVAKARPAGEGLDAGLLEQPGDAGGEAADDAVLPGDGAGEIERRRAGREAEGVAAGRRRGEFRVFVGGVDQRLRRDAPDVQAGAARAPGLDDHGVEPELAGADGADVAAGAGADHQQSAGDLLHRLSPPGRSAPGSR